MRTLSALFCCVWLFGHLGAVDAIPDFDHAVRPVLETHCIECHSTAKQKGELDLQTLATPDIDPTTLRRWRRVGTMLVNHEMPPEEASTKLSEAERDAVIGWVSAQRYHGPPDPGRVTLRRLNRVEYSNTIRDLFAVDGDFTRDFPDDDVGNGFDNSGDVLALPPLLYEKYLATAQRLVDRIIMVPQVSITVPLESVSVTTVGEAVVEAPLEGGARVLRQGATLRVGFFIPVSGKYRLRISLGADQVGNEQVAVALTLNGEPFKNLKVPAKRATPAAVTFPNLAFDRGDHQLDIVFLNPQRSEKNGKVEERVLALAGVDLQGPPAPAATAAHKALLVAEPGKDIDGPTAARRVLEIFLPKAWRRPVTSDELERMLALHAKGVAAGDPWHQAIKLPLMAALLSPHFLYRVERDGEGTVTALNDYELASRMSYFLWSTMPDGELFAAAAKGRLATADGRRDQVLRMLKHAKVRALAENFSGQWLQARSMADFTPDLKRYPEFTPALRTAMAAEPIDFTATIIREDRSVLEFIASDWTVVTGPLAKLYGIPGVEGTQPKKVALTDRDRGGVLTMAGVLAVTSNPDRTNPPRRGKFVLEQILNDPPPPPPPLAGQLPPRTGALAVKTVRALLEAHRADPSCASCHRRIDPLGFAFEGYDILGRKRTTDGASPIDTNGTLPDGTPISGVNDLRALLLGPRRQQFLRALAGKLLTFAIGRGLMPGDEPAVDGLVNQLSGAEHRFSALVLGIIESDSFLKRRRPGDQS